MPVIYVDQYEASTASLELTEPIYKVSQDDKQIKVGRATLPTTSWLVPVLVVGGVITVAWWLTKKS